MCIRDRGCSAEEEDRQRAVIECLSKEGCTAANIYGLLKNVYGMTAWKENNVLLYTTGPPPTTQIIL